MTKDNLAGVSGLEVRRHNGQCAYGPWMAIGDPAVPYWVEDLIGDEICKNDADEGKVSQGGSAWLWRKTFSGDTP